MFARCRGDTEIVVEKAKAMGVKLRALTLIVATAVVTPGATGVGHEGDTGVEVAPGDSARMNSTLIAG